MMGLAYRTTQDHEFTQQMKDVESAKFWYYSGPKNSTYRFNISMKDTERTQTIEQKMNYLKRRNLYYDDLHQMNTENILTSIVWKFIVMYI